MNRFCCRYHIKVNLLANILTLIGMWQNSFVLCLWGKAKLWIRPAWVFRDRTLCWPGSKIFRFQRTLHFSKEEHSFLIELPSLQNDFEQFPLQGLLIQGDHFLENIT